jgi:integrase
MHTTRAIIGDQAILAYLAELRQSHAYKYYLLAVVGLHTGLRIGDLLRLSYGDFSASKRDLVIREGKTGKLRHIAIGEALRVSVLRAKRLLGARDADYLFAGRYPGRPMCRSTAWRHLRAAAVTLGYQGIGTHSLRKTYAIQVLRATGGDIGEVSRRLNHTHASTTIQHYILPNIEVADMLRQSGLSLS